MTASLGQALRSGPRPAEARALCVLVHGRGQAPGDMAPLAAGWDGVAVLMPRAARGSWYDARAVDPLTPATAAQLEESLGAIDGAVAGLRAEAGRDLPLLLAGFSQGACLLIEWALSRGRWDGALAALTGCRVGEADRPGAALGGLPAYLTGADADPWIPPDAFGAAAGALARAGARLRAETVPGRPHEAAPFERARLSAMAAALAAGGDPLR